MSFEAQAAIQAVWNATAAGDPMPAFEALADDVIVDNGPGAGPWRHTEGKQAWIEFAMQFVPIFGDTWRQVGTCVYADERVSITVVHETGTAVESGDKFDNLAIWVLRNSATGKVDRIWTNDLAHEELESFWSRNSPAGIAI